MRRALVLLLLSACTEPKYANPGSGSDTGTPDEETPDDSGSVDPDDSGDTDEPLPDADGDGTHDGADCAPDDPDIHPGAAEIPYDGIDQDCDGLDETDWDGDGYDADIVGGSDCDDQDPSVYPGAQDDENGQDDDCDGEIDEDVPIIPTDWPVRFGGRSATVTADGVAVRADGMVFVAGTLDGRADFQPTYERRFEEENENSTVDLYLVSVDGDRVMDMLLTSPTDADSGVDTRDLILDEGGSPVITGAFSGTIDMDGGAPTYSRVSAGDTDAFVLRFNDLGEVIWAASFGGEGADVGAAAAASPAYTYVTGTFTGDLDVFSAGSATTGQGTTAVLEATAGGDEDGVVVAYDVTGTPAWAAQLAASTAGERVEGTAVASDAVTVWVAGTFDGTVDLDPAEDTSVLATSAGTGDVYVTALDAATGALQWSAVLPCTGEATLGGIDVDASGNLLLVGSFSGTIDLDPGGADTADASVGGTDAWIAVLDSSGNRVSSGVFGGSSDDALTDGGHDGSGGIVVTGGFSGTVGTGTTTLTSAGGSDCVTARFDAAGSEVWARGFGSADDETCGALDVASDGYVYFTGPMTAGFDFSTSGVDDPRRPAGVLDAWVHRLPLTP